ncbi:DUF3164 family protein, partial [Vibrio scophthalmi]
MTTQKIDTPEGYLKDRKGRLVPEDLVEAHDLEMNDFVIRMVQKAKEQQELLRQFKVEGFAE